MKKLAPFTVLDPIPRAELKKPGYFPGEVPS